MIDPMRPACLVVPLALITMLVGCTDEGGEGSAGEGHAEHGNHGGHSAPSATPTDSLPVLQPGRPGETNKTRSGSALRTTERTHPADRRFMTHMIVHHRQAVTMVQIVDGRLTDSKVRAIAGRIGAEQKPEIGYMSRWVRRHGGSASSSASGAPDSHDGHGAHSPSGNPSGPSDRPDSSSMPGMATPAQLAQLRRTSGVATDRLFLKLMIRHHEGAITMVGDRVQGGGTDPDVERFAGDIQSGQGSQIRHMRAMRTRLVTS